FRRRLKYYFMNPCEKYQARRRKPLKLMLQILKMALTTAQLVSFGLSNKMMVGFKDDSRVSFRRLFLEGYKDHRQGSYALYTRSDVNDRVRFIIGQYINLQNLTVGNVAYELVDGEYTPLSVCQKFYRKSNVFPENGTFDIDPCVDEGCLSIHPMQPLHRPPVNLSLDFGRLLSVSVRFTLKTINLQTVRHHELPDCYDFHVQILFDNRAHSGRITVNLETDVRISECRDWSVEGKSGKINYLLLLFDSVVILICSASLVLCMRSVITGIQLQFEFKLFFHTYFNKAVTWSERMEFVNGWYLLIILSDTLTVAGSALKIGIQTKYLANYDVCSILLGSATLLAWVGVIRYFGFFRKYNVRALGGGHFGPGKILILTLRAAFPNVVRFSCCAAMMYLGYCFCGWIVLGALS
ncbi:unnamed protein product, partial [Tetraodon nigroviridis]